MAVSSRAQPGPAIVGRAAVVCARGRMMSRSASALLAATEGVSLPRRERGGGWMARVDSDSGV